jgi:hypothetical protein
MNTNNNCAANLLDSLCAVSERLHDFRFQLSKNPAVAAVTSQTHCRKPLSYSRPWIEFYVSAEYRDSSSIYWYCNLDWNAQQWCLERHIYKHDPDEDGAHVILELPKIESQDWEMLISGLEEWVQEVLIDEALLPE